MRYLLAFILSVSAFFAQAQQVNPVTDYTFANRMSSGRSTVTDTAAYFSIGPRYGAVRGMMPPMVTDTVAMSANKRNGLLIFSIQKNKYQVWDSAGAKWADITGAAGSAIISADTAAMLLPYLRKADTTAMLLPYLRKADTTAMLLPYLRKADTTAMLLPYLRKSDTTAMLLPYLRKSDTVWLSNRINLKLNISDTSSMLNPYLRGSGTANYLHIFDATRSVVNSKVYQTGTNLLFNTTTASFTSAGISTIENNATSSAVYTFKTNDSLRAYIGWGGASTMDINNLRTGDIRFYTSATLRGRFQTDGTFRLNSLTGTGDRIVTADANGVLSATSSATGLVDTTVLSTRAWRQKGIDSVNANVALKVNISDTSSMLGNYIRHAGNGLTKSGQALSVDTAAMATRARVQKAVDSLNGVIATKGSGTVTSVATGYGLSGGTITTTGTISADTLQLSTRAWRKKGLDSLAALEISGSGTTNYVPKFTDTRVIGNSAIFDNSGELLFGTTTDQGDYRLQVSGNSYLSATTIIGPASGALGVGTTSPQVKFVVSNGGANGYEFDPVNSFISSYNRSTNVWTAVTHRAGSYIFNINNSNNAVSITSSGELLVNTVTDAGDYKLQVSGNAYVTGTTVLAATSGNVGVGTASPTTKLHLAESNSGAFASVVLLSNTANTANDRTGIFGSPAVGNSLPYRGGIVFNPGASGYVSIHTGNNANPSDGERIRISGTTGNVLVNTATDAGNYKLQVAGDVLFSTTSGFNSFITHPLSGGGIAMVSTSNPSAAADRLFSLGFGSTTYPAQVRVEAYATEAWTSTNRGSYLSFSTTNTTTNTRTEKIRVNDNGGIRFIGQSAAPTAEAGTVYYDTDDNKLKVYNGTTWVDLH